MEMNSIFEDWKFTLSLSMLYLTISVMNGGLSNVLIFCLIYWISIRQFNRNYNR